MLPRSFPLGMLKTRILPISVPTRRFYATIPSWASSLADPLNPTHLRQYFVDKYARKKAEHKSRASPNYDRQNSSDNVVDQVQKEALTEEEDEDSIGHFGMVNPREIFINNELNLDRVEVYGFDYDYTLANYTEMLSKTIYQILRDILINHMRYPSKLREIEFDPDFAIRGLHYDFQHGYLMKIDSFNNIQTSTVHLGREPLQNLSLITSIHNGFHVSPKYMAENMYQLNDLFSVPEACLLSDVLQHFKSSNINFHPRYLYDDIKSAARILHSGGSREVMGGWLHSRVMEKVDQYLSPSAHLVSYLERLRTHGKSIFLLTNSSYPFIDNGLSYITGRKDWTDLFDLIIVSANKPSFYQNGNRRPFRRTKDTGELGDWAVVNKFKKGEIYQGGNVGIFSEMTGWVGNKVMYVGDHVFGDLVEPNVQQGWRTGAIIRELATEISIRNTPTYRHSLAWLLHLEVLIKQAQAAKRENSKHNEFDQVEPILQQWREERKELRFELKAVFNNHFGSVFRTHHNPTFFANKIQRFADVYTSDLENFNTYPLDYIFYPERTYLPHERLVETLVDTGRLNALM